MNTICPYCKAPLQIEVTAQFASQVDPSIVEVYRSNIERMKQIAKTQGGLFGGLMGMGAGVSQSMQGLTTRVFEAMEKYPPMITILRCMSCGAALSVHLPESSSGSH
jgi:hypothetical protein